MDKCFSIGEVSKLHNISVQTLRYYDKIGLLTPAYIDDFSKYRYYSTKHFMRIGFIKQCKAMGLTLEEIKVLIDQHTSIEAVLETITKQKGLVGKKIQEMKQIENNIETLQNKIITALEEGIGQVFIKSCPERYFITYKNNKKHREAFAIKLTEVIQELESEYGAIYKELTFANDYKIFKQQQKINDEHMMIGCKKISKGHIDKQVILPAGNYVTINFDDTFKGTKAYYEKIKQYIEENQLKVGDTLYETYMITRVDMRNRETSLGQIQIQLLEDKR